jgi:hypothetical protein
MNVEELSDLLRRDGYARRWYSFDREYPPFDGYVLEKVGERWTVFYCERGDARDIANFESEADACEYFFQEMQRVYGSTLQRTPH